MHRVEITSRAVKDLNRLPLSVRTRVEAAISGLGIDPRPPGCIKLAGRENTWRIRVSDYRVLYQIDDKVITVIIIRVAHRRESYR